MFKSVSSLSQRWVSLRRGSEISFEMQLKIIPYVNCTVQFLNNDKYIEYSSEAEYDTEHLKDTETIFDILGILDHCADTESYRIVQVQLSRIVLYHLKEKDLTVKPSTPSISIRRRWRIFTRARTAVKRTTTG